MKIFKDLVFKKKEYGSGCQAIIKFSNNYGASVITGFGSYSSKTKPYEVAILLDGNICYTSGITEDVIGHLDEEEVSDLLIEIQKLNPCK